MRVLRSASYKRMPWKNGKGETLEISVFPASASANEFDWRISVATVAEDGPFSVFPEIDRTLSVLAGKGMELSVAGRDPIMLEQAGAPYAFPGDLPTTARLADGPVTDLNVMTRRGRFMHAVAPIAAPLELQADSLTLVFCFGGHTRISCGDSFEQLNPRDCAMFEPGETASLFGDGEVLAVRLW